MLQIKSENNTASRKKRMQIKRKNKKYMKIEPIAEEREKVLRKLKQH